MLSCLRCISFEDLYSSGVTLTNNEIKDVVIVISSIQNRRALLKGTTGKFIDKEGGLLSFLDQLMKACFPLMENLLALPAKNVCCHKE